MSAEAKICPACKEKNNPSFDKCWKCGGLMDTKSSSSRRGAWGAAVMNMASAFETAGSSFFDSCVETLQEASSDPNRLYEIEINNTQIAGAADCAIKVFQLYMASDFIAQHGYVAENEGKDFADIFYASVCGKDIRECLNYLNRYLEVANDGGTLLSRFCCDVAKHITHSDSPLAETMLITSLCPWLVTNVHLFAAAAFGDLVTVKKLGENAKKRFYK